MILNSKKTTDKCPVCGAVFGTRFLSIHRQYHCDECRATFEFLPGIKKPIARLDKHKPQRCHCGNTPWCN